MPSVLFGISGSIAAYRSLELIRMLVADGIDVHPVLSKGGVEFVTKVSLEALSGNRVMSAIFDDKAEDDIEHIALVRDTVLMVTCPASADIIAKYAAGIADDPLALVTLTYGTPHLIAPAMNHRMWNNPATQANVKTLKSRGFEFVGPDVGLMACNEVGPGRLSEIGEIYGVICKMLGAGGPLDGKKVLVSSGATKEQIDDVRYLTNRSSGVMGNALASRARNLGASVVLVSSSMCIPATTASGIEVVTADSAEAMHKEVTGRAREMDVIIMVAAVSDYTPKEKADGKLKKGDVALNLELVRTKDILAELGGAKRNGQILVGFAAEFGASGRDEAKRKLKDKNCDLICLNDISRDDAGFGSENNEVILIHPDGTERILEFAPKPEIASGILNEIISLL